MYILKFPLKSVIQCTVHSGEIALYFCSKQKRSHLTLEPTNSKLLVSAVYSNATKFYANMNLDAKG